MFRISTLVGRLLEHPGEDNKRGNAVHRLFWSAERYAVDFAPDAGGWDQYDTSQDAWYFGVWINRRSLHALTYCEGDWSLVVCQSAAAFNAELESMGEFYEDGFQCIAIDTDAGTSTRYVQDRERFRVAEGGG